MSLERPNWYDMKDRELYYDYFYNSDKPLSKYPKKEQDFIKTMYHMEEFACGLDGD